MKSEDQRPIKPLKAEIHMKKVADEELQDGIFILSDPGIFYFMNFFVKGQMVAFIHVIIHPVQITSKIINPHTNLVKPAVRHMVGKIINMETLEHFRREGVMTELLEALQQLHDGEVKYIITSAVESSDAGTATLIKNGFVKEGTVLIWRRDGKDGV